MKNKILLLFISFMAIFSITLAIADDKKFLVEWNYNIAKKDNIKGFRIYKIVDKTPFLVWSTTDVSLREIETLLPVNRGENDFIIVPHDNENEGSPTETKIVYLGKTSNLKITEK